MVDAGGRRNNSRRGSARVRDVPARPAHLTGTVRTARLGQMMDLEAAAAVLGVHYQTAYRWVRLGLLPAVKVGSGYSLNPEEVAAVLEERRQRPPTSGCGTRDWAMLTAELSRYLLAGDDGSARGLVDRLQAAHVAPIVLFERLIVPSIRMLEADRVSGAMVQGEFAVAAEMCERMVVSLAAPPRGRPRGLALVAGLEGDRQRLPALLTTAVLRADRWRVHNLGSQVPARDLVEFIAETLPDLVVLSVTDEAPNTVAFCRALHSVSIVPVVVHEYAAPLEELLSALHEVTKRPGQLQRGGPSGHGTTAADKAIMSSAIAQSSSDQRATPRER